MIFGCFNHDATIGATTAMKFAGPFFALSFPFQAVASDDCSYALTDETGFSLICLDEAALDAHAEAETAFEQALMENADTKDLEAAFGDARNEDLIVQDEVWFDATATSCRTEMLDLAPGDPQKNAYSRCIEAAAKARLATHLQEFNRIRRTK